MLRPVLPRVRSFVSEHRTVILLFLVSRLIASTGQAVAILVTGHHLGGRWDGVWYLAIARSGYPHVLRPPGEPFSRWAFFPLFPLAIAAVHAVTRLPLSASATTLNAILQVVLAVSVWRLSRTVLDREAAIRAFGLFWLFPGAAVLSMTYSEPLFLVAATAALLMLHRRRWLLAGLLGAVATATRPTGLAVEAACLVAAFLAVRRGGWSQLRALVAPLLCPLGFVAFLLYGAVQAHDVLVWRRAERLWHQHFDFSLGLVEKWQRHFGHIEEHTWSTALVTLGLVLVLLTLWWLARDRPALPAPMVAFALAMVLFSLSDSNVSTRPRFVLSMVPLFFVAARHVRGRAWLATTAASGALLGVTSFAYIAANHGAP